MPDENLYFIAIIPPEPVYGAVVNWKNEFAEKFNSKAALRSPPHITLHMPFKWREDKEERIDLALEELSQKHTSFKLTLDGFGAFKPRSIFVHVVNNEKLNSLQQGLKQQMKTSLNIFNAAYKDRPFRPHMTLAFRDLKKQIFPEAWQQFEPKNYEAAFPVHEVVLLKHNGKSWDVYKRFALGV